MKRKREQVCQFKITLLGVKPQIWRRIHVPQSYSFYDLHVAIQDAMGWLDCHLHAFQIRDPDTGEEVAIGFPDDEGFGLPFLAGWELAIADFFHAENSTARYEYDFGDGWEHEVVLEGIVPSRERTRYPQCTEGERACPPEDCGGVHGYVDFLEAIGNSDHEEHESMLEWVGGKFYPEAFDPKKVRFDNPKKRWELAFGGEVI